jgi:hypothetical protein
MCCARFEVLTAVTVNHTVFWDVMPAAYCFAYSLTLKVQAACSSKMSVNFCQTTNSSTFNDVLFSRGYRTSLVW